MNNLSSAVADAVLETLAFEKDPDVYSAVECGLFWAAYKFNEQSISGVARQFNISRNTARVRLKKHGVIK